MELYGDCYSLNKIHNMIVSGEMIASDLDDTTLSLLIDYENRILATDSTYSTVALTEFLLDAERRNNFKGKEVPEKHDVFLMHVFKSVGWENSAAVAVKRLPFTNTPSRNCCKNLYYKKLASFVAMLVVVLLFRVSFANGDYLFFSDCNMKRAESFLLNKASFSPKSSDAHSIDNSNIRFYTDIEFAFKCEGFANAMQPVLSTKYVLKDINCIDSAGGKIMELCYAKGNDCVQLFIKTNPSLVRSAKEILLSDSYIYNNKNYITYIHNDLYCANIVFDEYLYEILCSDNETLYEIITASANTALPQGSGH